MTMKAVAYVRVSTEDQAARGVSLEAQRAKIAAYAGLYDLDLVAVVEDAGVSARTMDRPGLQRALAMLARGEAQALIVLKLDRLTRSVRDLGELLEGPFARAALLSVGEQIDTRTAAGRLVLNVLASVAQWERETIGERTATAMAHKKTKGERVGAVPYGYGLGADGHALAPVAAEQAVIGAARRLKASGLALRTIAAELERAGMVARNGRRFEAAQVQRMVAA
jgi:site-specific DNA recombinase